MGKKEWSSLAMCLSQEKLDEISCSRMPQPNEYLCRSDEDETYNCLSWVAGDNTRHWFPGALEGTRGVYWPNRSKSLKTEDVIAAFELHGFSSCTNGSLEIDIEKIAFFSDGDNDVRHAAWQRETGAWSSKLGNYEDVDHMELRLFEGGYGVLKAFMQKRRERFERDFPTPPSVVQVI
jgi:hypothetical protein